MNKADARFAKFVIVLNGLVPAILLAWDAYRHQLGVNAVNYALHTTGLLAFIFLILSLLVTPLRKLTGWNVLISFRRALGLYGFFYACAHFLIFFAFDRALSVSSTLHEVLSRTYLQIGTAGLLLMVPLAATSTNAMVMRVGAKRWKALHRLSYVVAIAAALHYYLLVKSDVRQPLAFAGILALLLGYRVVRYLIDRQNVARTRRSPLRPLAPAKLSAGATSITASAAPPLRPRFWSGLLRVARVFEETADVRTFRLVADDGGELPFRHQPGQYLNLALTIDGKRVNRSYTIASSPTRGHYCEITVKRATKGYGSCHLHDTLRAGDRVKVSAPAGRFIFDGSAGDQVLLIAGGVGITPLMSMIRYLTDRCWPGDIYLVFSVRRRSELIFQEELTYLERRFPNLHVCTTLTQEEDAAWIGARGHVDEALLRRFVPDLKSGPVYLCGPEGMMTRMRELLLTMGLRENDVNTEAFVSPPSPSLSPSQSDSQSLSVTEPVLMSETAAALTSPPATEVRAWSVRFQRSGSVLETSSGPTLLEAAEAAGISLPFECRSGICGQCKTRLLVGRVRMDSDDALTKAESAQGLILVCQAHATEDVTLDA